MWDCEREMERIFHIVERGTWALADSAGEYRPESLQSEGFVHFSFADQVEATANLRYADAVNLCVIEIDPERVGAPVVVEDSYSTGTAFPHVYAPIPTAAAVAIHDLTRSAEGTHRFTPPDAPG
ncbi:MAG: hypothetical protein QOG80_206 [Pseudonocardiales bacterium]|jgi:uncharacterized protein (DUF952 family)|nr:hypothetical protein [Pseudonocardiales bacterium]